MIGKAHEQVSTPAERSQARAACAVAAAAGLPVGVHHLTVTADSSAVSAASAWIRSLGGRSGITPDDLFRLDLCVSEVVMNIASYGYAEGAERVVDLHAEGAADNAGIRVEIEDRGAPFDPLSVPTLQFSPPTVGETRVGGFGIQLIRNFADECSYVRCGDRNVLTVTIRRSTAAADGQYFGGRTDRGSERRRNSAPPAFPLARSGGQLAAREERTLQERRRLGFISGCRLFRDIPYHLLEELVAGCPVRSVTQEEVLLSPGDRNRHIVLVLSGSMRVHLGSVDSPDYTEIACGECAGEMSVIDGKPVSAYVVAAAGSRLMMIDGETFLARILPIPGVARNLVEALTDRMRRTNDRIIERFKSSIELQALQRELLFAREVHAGMVPERITLEPSRPELQCSGYMRPARQVGGDFYDAFYMEAGRLAVVMGDVCGKGMPAALYMARTMTLLRSEAMHKRARTQRQHTLDIAESTNRMLCRNNDAGYFVSVFAGVLDITTGLLTWVNAGHPAPAMARGSSEFRFLTGPRHLLMGVSEEARYTVGETALPPGSALLLYTDGAMEAENAQGTMFGSARLLGLLNEAKNRDAQAIIDTAVEAVDAFAEGRAQGDDLTLLALRYAGAL